MNDKDERMIGEDIRMARSESQKRANRKYHDKAYEKVSFDSRRENRLNELINYAAIKTRKSKAQYITDALNIQFKRDGISIDMLPSKDVVIPREKPGRRRMLKEYMVYETLIEDKEVKFWEDTFIITTEIDKAREKLAAAIKKSKGDENAIPYIRGWKFTAYNKKEAIDKCKEMIDSTEFELDEEGEITNITNHVREPDYVEGLDGK